MVWRTTSSRERHRKSTVGVGALDRAAAGDARHAGLLLHPIVARGRLRRALAASSPGNDSLFGSHFSFRPSCMAMLPMCIAVLRKWSEITSRTPMYPAHSVCAAKKSMEFVPLFGRT